MPSSRQMSFTATPCSARFRAPMICSSLYLLLRMMTSWSRPPSCRNSSYPWSDFKGGGHVDVDDQMVMIRENRVGTDVDGEHLGQQRKPVLDFFLTGRIVLAGIGVDAAQKMSPNTATDDMIERRYLGRDESFAGLRHGCSVGDR